MNEFAELTTRVLALRDVVVRLLAYEALRCDDARGLFNEFSEATADHIESASKSTGEPDHPEVADMAEGVRNELDLIIGDAQRIVRATRGG